MCDLFLWGIDVFLTKEGENEYDLAVMNMSISITHGEFDSYPQGLLPELYQRYRNKSLDTFPFEERAEQVLDIFKEWGLGKYDFDQIPPLLALEYYEEAPRELRIEGIDCLYTLDILIWDNPEKFVSLANELLVCDDPDNVLIAADFFLSYPQLEPVAQQKTMDILNATDYFVASEFFKRVNNTYELMYSRYKESQKKVKELENRTDRLTQDFQNKINCLQNRIDRLTQDLEESKARPDGEYYYRAKFEFERLNLL
jgi:hypothetical protein